jgi:ankyrin repeat protein
LHHAAKEKHNAVLEVVRLLLTNNADVNAKDKGGWTPLHIAASYGCKEVVKLLLAKKADVNAKTFDGETSLSRAIYFGHSEIVEMLLAKGADVNAVENVGNSPYLLRAAYDGTINMVKSLLHHGADPNTKGKDGETALHRAALQGRDDVVELLLAENADINATTITGETVMAYATRGEDNAAIIRENIRLGHPPVNIFYQALADGSCARVKELLRAALRQQAKTEPSATVRVGPPKQVTAGCGKLQNEEHDWSNGYKECLKCGESGYNVCLKALKKDDLETVEYFLQLGMDPLQSYWTDGHKNTSGLFEYGQGQGPEADRPLICAIQRDNLAAFKLMDRYGSVLEIKCEGASMLIHATRSMSRKIIEHIIDFAPDQISSKDNDGRTPLHYAACSERGGHIVALLLAKGGQVNAKCNRGYTPLHLAAANGACNSAEVLLSNGADVNAKANDGGTPLIEAKTIGDKEMLELLCKHGGHE